MIKMGCLHFFSPDPHASMRCRTLQPWMSLVIQGGGRASMGTRIHFSLVMWLATTRVRRTWELKTRSLPPDVTESNLKILNRKTSDLPPTAPMLRFKNVELFQEVFFPVLEALDWSALLGHLAQREGHLLLSLWSWSHTRGTMSYVRLALQRTYDVQAPA